MLLLEIIFLLDITRLIQKNILTPRISDITTAKLDKTMVK